MSEDLEQQKTAEDEAKRQIRDQELARILAMSKEERLKLIVTPSCFIQSQSRFDDEALLLDADHPRLFEVARWGQHSMMEQNLRFKILDDEMDGSEHDDGSAKYNDELWRATSHEINLFLSKIIKIYIQIDDPVIVEGGQN